MVNYCEQCSIESDARTYLAGYGWLCPICWELLATIRFSSYWIEKHTEWIAEGKPERH